MSKNILDNLFSSRVRIKVLKFLFRNYPEDFTLRDLVNRTQEPPEIIRRELETLRYVGLIKKRR